MISLATYFVIYVGVLLLIRVIVLWYFKIDEHLENQREIISLLSKSVKQQGVDVPQYKTESRTGAARIFPGMGPRSNDPDINICPICETHVPKIYKKCPKCSHEF